MDPVLAATFPQPHMPAPVTITVTPTAVPEAENHIPHPTNHPPYAEMIFAAITALKEKNGSSKIAIAKYIERVYSGLPPTHSALLTHHLKRLKSSGLLVMVKKSYKLPRSDAPSSPPPLTGPGRGRGRPPKPKPTTNPEPNAQPVLVALGLVDEPNAQPVAVKKGPGRPRKSGLVGQPGPVKRARGRPPGSVGLKPRLTKRTPKPKSVTAVLGSNGLKRGRGRPPKPQLQTMVIPFAPNNFAAVAPAADLPRPRGRPKKDAAAPGAVAEVFGVPRKPKKSTGRPVGRPKKNAAAFAIPEAPEMQPIAYVDLKRKLEYIQSKVKEVVGVLKPQVTNDSARSIVAAIEELEGLASMDIITAPLQVETQQLQQPQQLPQQQPLPHYQ